MISVVIPSYRNPTYLDLCLRSAIENQTQNNQIIVVLDGFADESKDVLDKYPGIDVIAFEENRGQMVAHNTGVTLAEHEHVLIVNDDNVFPYKWDQLLEHAASLRGDKTAITPNQMEPKPSIFKSFIIKNFGTTPENFKYDEFQAWSQHQVHTFQPLEKSPLKQWPFTDDGNTWPLFIRKKWFMAVGGFDVSFPSPAVADHDLFLRLEMNDVICARYTDCTFYHFAGASTKATEKRTWVHNVKEAQSHEYFQYKWGFSSTFDENNSHLPRNKIIRGIHF